MPAATKRKSDEGAAAPRAKRSKAAPDFSDAKDMVDALLDGDSDGDGTLSAPEACRLAEYVRWLEREVAATKPKQKSSEDIRAAADKLCNACVSGIKKQMAWKPSCKTGGAKWSYDGVCADPTVFGAMLRLVAAPKWKMHKYTAEEFQDVMGDISSSARYDDLRLMGNVTVRYQPDEGTFKMSGSYGAPRHANK
ncbi:hypothetical protein GGX14DRAFT_475144 [Mycena pura]|uniref:Uncharacterized protein n=1 Tax=Mycena pura TaxID=153505 RepID=A0AAD6UVI1_9AGAR|nr:hypothetical protein GGX14DRAFT_475144 [Mycena pura]